LKTVSLVLSDRMDGPRSNSGDHNYMTYITGRGAPSDIFRYTII
jgi:hypothetical protein